MIIQRVLLKLQFPENKKVPMIDDKHENNYLEKRKQFLSTYLNRKSKAKLKKSIKINPL